MAALLLGNPGRVSTYVGERPAPVPRVPSMTSRSQRYSAESGGDSGAQCIRKDGIPVISAHIYRIPAKAPKASSERGTRCGALLHAMISALALAGLCRGTQARLADMSLEQLGSIEVTTVSKEPEEVWKTPAAVYVLTQEDIRRSGATSIPEALRLAPGVEVARVDSDHWSVGIRGFGAVLANKLLVLIDGRSVYTPLYAGVYWQAQNMPLEDIDRIEIIRGPGGTIWGANAVDGVINIITKSSRDTHGSMLSLGGGDVDEGTAGSR